MLSAADNALLTRTGAGTPMGDYFRRYWQPVLLAEELPAPDCPPVRVTVMGEDLLAFRETGGRIGLVDPRCPHRGADLFHGRNEESGIRCAFHGWKFDVDGHCVDMPSAPPDTGYRERMRIKAYPTREWGELVWAYMGPPDANAELPQMDFAHMPPAHRLVGKKLQECNWAQSVEGGLDTAHFSFLHMPATGVRFGNAAGAVAQANADVQRLAWMRDDPVPRFTVIQHAAGFVAGAARKTGGADLYWRISQFMLPNHGLAPNALAGENYQGQTWVPIDDTSCWIYCYAWNPDRPLTPEERAKFSAGHGVFAALVAGYMPLRNRANQYLLDRTEQKNLSFTGVRGVAEQDAMIQDSQGRIADRTREHLGPTDLAIVRFRRMMLAGANELCAGKAPLAAVKGAAYRLRSGSAIVDGALPFEEVMRTRFGNTEGKVLQDARVEPE